VVRRSPKFTGKRKGDNGKNKGKMRRSEYRRVAMLDIRRENAFDYDLRRIFEAAGFTEDTAAPLIANITTKGSRVSLEDAKEYTRRMLEENKIEKKTCNEICSLLDHYRKYR
jgi:hypothetical protein